MHDNRLEETKDARQLKARQDSGLDPEKEKGPWCKTGEIQIQFSCWLVFMYRCQFLPCYLYYGYAR